MNIEIPSAVTEARSEAGRLGKIASDYAASSFTIPDQLRKTVQEALDYNKDVIQMRSTALADYMVAPDQANAKFGVQKFESGDKAGQANPDYIFNPFERNSAIQSFIGNQSVPFSFANTLLGMREGTIDRTVDAGTRAFQAQVAATQAAAEAARQTYNDVLSEFTTKTQLQQEQERIEIAKLEANKKASSGSGDYSGLFSNLFGASQLPSMIDLSAAIEQDKPKRQAPKVNLSGSIKAAGTSLSPGMSGTVVNQQAPKSSGDGKWAFQWLSDLIKGPQLSNNYASLGSLGF